MTEQTTLTGAFGYLRSEEKVVSKEKMLGAEKQEDIPFRIVIVFISQTNLGHLIRFTQRSVPYHCSTDVHGNRTPLYEAEN